VYPNSSDVWITEFAFFNIFVSRKIWLCYIRV
jgi:hypothetical protein